MRDEDKGAAARMEACCSGGVAEAPGAAGPGAAAPGGDGPAVVRGSAPRIVAFLCNWCSYAGADLAGTSRLQYPPHVRVIRVPCSGRINPQYIIKALAEGADGVLVSGCHPGDCHYLTGNLYARRRFAVLKRLLELAGYESDRVQFTWVSASEGGRFAEVIREVSAKVEALGRARAAEARGVAVEATAAPAPASVAGAGL